MFLTAPDFWECLSDRGINGGGIKHFTQEYAKIPGASDFTENDWLTENEIDPSILDTSVKVTRAHFLREKEDFEILA